MNKHLIFSSELIFRKQRGAIFIAVLFVFAATFSGFAQKNDSVVNKSVTVTRDFQPIITDVGKVITDPKTVEPVVDKSKPIYSDITTPLSIDYSVHTLPAVELALASQAANKGFLRLGIGLPLNTLADFTYPVLNDERNRLDVAIHHLGAFIDKKHTKTSALINYNHLFQKFDLYAAVGGAHDYFNYYGRPYNISGPFIMSDVAGKSKFGEAIYKTPELSETTLYDLSGLPLDNVQWRANVSVGARSLPLADDFIFDASLNYRLFNNRKATIFSENQVIFKGLFEVPFELNRLGMDVNIFNFNYTGILDAKFTFPENYTLIKLNPYYKLVGDEWYVRFGGKLGITFGGAGQIFAPSADVSAKWNVIPQYLSIYGAVTGDMTVNSLFDTYDENRYISSHVRVKDTYTPIDTYVGAMFSPVHNLLIDIYGQYKLINNQYFYVNREYNRTGIVPDGMGDEFAKVFHNRFDVIYARANRATVGLRTSWDYKNQVNLYVKGAYHFWDVNEQAQAWHLPNWDIDFGANLKVGNDISFNTQFIFQDGRYAKLADPQGTPLNAVFDWNAGVSYAYRDWVSVFLRVNNILNKKYEFYKGYEVQGINAMIGAAFSF